MTNAIPIPQGAQLVPLNQGTVPIPEGATLQPLSPGPTAQDKAAEGFALTPWRAITGIGKGALQTTAGASSLINKIPGIGETLAPQQGIQRMQIAAQPNNPGEAFGKGAEQLGEFMLPGLGEEAAAAKGATLLPFLGKLAKPAAQLAYQGATTGAVNKLQGGDFGTGAGAGVLGGLFGMGAKKLAPSIAESALGIPNRVRKYGAQPGEAILNDLKGITPDALKEGADNAVSDLSHFASEAAKESPIPASLAPARDFINQEISAAQQRNSPTLVKNLAKIKDQLTYEFDARGKPLMVPTTVTSQKPGAILDEFGKPVMQTVSSQGRPVESILPKQVSASKIRAMRQGIDEEIKSWTPPGAKPDSTVEAIRKQLYGILGQASHESAPATVLHDAQMSSLIPVSDYAGNKALAEGTASQVMKRLQNPTGALVGAAAGGGLGYKERGIPGALAGAGMGLIAPSIVSSPRLWLAAARAANAAPKAVPAIVGTGLQAGRKSPFYGGN